MSTMPKGVRSTKNAATKPGVSKPKKKASVPALTKEEIGSQLQKLSESESRLTKEVGKTRTDLERLGENYQREHQEGVSSRQVAINAVKERDKSGLESVQKAAMGSTQQIERVITRTKKYLGDLHRELSQTKTQKDRLRRELQNVERIELAQKVATLIPQYFEAAAEQRERFQQMKDLTAQLRSGGQDWATIIDPMVTQLEKVALDSIIPRCKSPQDFEMELRSLGGVYSGGNVFHQEYADLQQKPHHDLRLDRPSFGTDSSGALGRGGVAIK